MQSKAVWDEHKTIGTHARCEADGSVNGRTALGLEASIAENCAQAAGDAGLDSDPATPRKARPSVNVASTPPKGKRKTTGAHAPCEADGSVSGRTALGEFLTPKLHEEKKTIDAHV